MNSYRAFDEVEGKIYTLADKNGNVFYVGCTISSVESRLYYHLCEARQDYHWSNRRKVKIIQDLNFEVVATVVHTKMLKGEYYWDVKKELEEIELEWIKKYILLGHNLTNLENKNKKFRQKAFNS